MSTKAAGGVWARFRGARRPPLLLWTLAGGTVAIVLLPLVYLLVRSLEGGGRGWSVLARHTTADVIGTTVALTAAVVLASSVIGVSLAWLATHTDLPWRRALAVASALPLVIPSYVAALALLGALGPRGLLQQALEGPFGVERVPAIYGFPGALLALTLSSYPFVFLLASAGFRAVDPTLEEASLGLGRSRFATFWRVTLPAARQSILAGAVLAALYALSDFGAVSLMRETTLTRAIFVQYRSLFDRTPAAVLGLVLVALTALILLAEARARRGPAHRRGPGTPRRQTPIALGAWRWPAFAYALACLALFLALPLAVLGYWLVRGISDGQDFGEVWSPLASSALVALAAAGAAALAALPIAVLATRFRSRPAAALERLAFAGNALPGIVIALSLVYFAARYASPVYQTLFLLLVAYVIRFLPEALSGATSALAAVDPRLEEAATGLGRRRLTAFLGVTFPLAWPGIVAGAALVALSTLKELPATLLLRPIGFETLATEIWQYTSVASYSRAALPALLLVALAAPVTLVLFRRADARSVPT